MTEQNIEQTVESEILVWNQTVKQHINGEIGIEMDVNPEIRPFLKETHYGLIESVTKQIMTDVIWSINSSLGKDTETKIIK